MKTETYRSVLASLPRSEWDVYLMAESGLPGPRGNLELAQAAAALADEGQLARWRALAPGPAPVNSPQEFLVFCGVLGLGWALNNAPAQAAALKTLRLFASDPRWRTREAVAMALQHWGVSDAAGLLSVMDGWAEGSFFEQRAVVAAICEPAVLAQVEPEDVPIQGKIFDLLDRITRSFARAADRERRGNAGWEALKKGLAYAWSVAVAGLPAEGRPHFERQCASPDPDVRWVMRENLKKARLVRMDAAWAGFWKEKLERET